MQLGFVSAILPELSLEEVLKFASGEGFDCVELMCWPRGRAERRYAGVTHLDAAGFGPPQADQVKGMLAKYKVAVSGLGYYPNPLCADPLDRRSHIDHIRAVIAAAAALGVGVVNTFVGRDPSKSVEDNWPAFRAVWPDLIRFAAETGVKIGIENCPMLFSDDEWPGGKNLAVSPAIWRKMFAEIPAANFGLNYDPSHMIWQMMDYVKPIREFAARLHHIHAKDVRIDRDALDAVGVMGLKWHTPKLPGLGDVNWGQFFSALSDVGYKGAVCIEAEDRAYEGALADRKRALIQTRRFLLQFMS
jgi:sugar phosphate isomerase/epimerase